MPQNETATQRARRLRCEATPAENALWQQLRRRQVRGVKFRRQHCLAGELYADFCCIEQRLVVEVDGVHHAEPGNEQADHRRTQRLRADGYQVIRFSNEEVLGDPDRVAKEIARTIDEQRRHHPYRPRRIAGR